MGYYDTLSPEELEKYKIDYIEDKETNKKYSVIYRNDRYEISFFTDWLYIPPILLRHKVGTFHMNKNKKICFDFADECPQEIKDSIINYYGNGTKGMIFTNTLTGKQSDTLEGE